MTALTYTDFLAAKRLTVRPLGRDVDEADVHPFLHPWQRRIVAWAVRTGRAALWEDTGLGKTLQQIEWARLSGKRALIVAPLAVCQQTVREAAKISVTAAYVRNGADAQGPGVWVTNYEMTPHFDAATFDAVVLDESSILKDVTTKTRDRLIAEFACVPYRLACTATPAPNDTAELANHAEFLGVATRREMLSTYFVHDQDGWRVKGHARGPLFRWMTSWAVALRKPSDLGYPDGGYDLPPLRIVPHLLDVDVEVEGQLFATDLGGVGGRARVRKATLTARCERVTELVNAEPGRPWVLWCGLNDEQTHLERAFGDRCLSLTGSQTPEEKVTVLYRWLDGDRSILLTKPSIAGMGINMQHCARMAFVGMNDSYEAYYQAIRRCYRYGQTAEVHAHIVLSALEGQIAANVARKEASAAANTSALITEMATIWRAA